jgi:hypothetical protein
VVDAFLTQGEPIDGSPYLQKLEGYCGDVNRRVEQLGNVESRSEARRLVARATDFLNRFYGRIDKLKPPKEYRAMHRDVRKAVAADKALVSKFKAALGGGKVDLAGMKRDVAKVRKATQTLDLELAAAGLNDCR